MPVPPQKWRRGELGEVSNARPVSKVEEKGVRRVFKCPPYRKNDSDGHLKKIFLVLTILFRSTHDSINP